MAQLSSQNARSLPYRPDIDGLRALAVTAVVLYHFFPTLLPGGFIGVDVFFVISGYLISSIILSQLQTGKFRFAVFYSHRAWRLFPALILTLSVTLVYGLFRLQIDELVQLLKHALGSALFVSNFIFLKESGYFDSAAEAKPLLHMWSLSIEEQFYLLWPLILFFIYKKKRFLPLCLFLLFVGSFWLCVRQMKIDPITAFYLPYTRFWELLAGAALAMRQQLNHRLESESRFSNLQSILGITLLSSGFWGISQNTIFPGWWALLPVVGSTLLISAGQHATINRIILSRPIVVGIGLISYPLYLWHVPLLAYLNIETSHSHSSLIRVSLLFASVVLAVLTYRFVERPMRKFHTKNLATGALLSCMLIVTVFAGGLLLKYQGNDAATNISADKAISETQNDFYLFYADAPHGRWRTFFERKFRHDCSFFMLEQFYAGNPTQTPKTSIADSCFTRDPKVAHSVLIWGDSHAQMLNSGLIDNLPTTWQVLQVASSGCVPSLSFSQESKTQYCAQSNWFALHTALRIKPDVVILAQHDFHLASELNSLARRLISAGIKKVLIIGPAPRWKDDLPKLVIRQLWAEQPERTMKGVDIDFIRQNDNLKRLIKQTDQIQYVDMMNLFCDSKGCLTRLGSQLDHNLTTWDRGHLTELASDYFAKHLLVPTILK
jgi:peptidoglycan/LPS O-acetylase OafA/YrhL